jgi:ABC-type spermidine/putrescine transport system, permease component II
LIAILSSLFATIIGTFGALGIAGRKSQRTKSALLTLNNVLMVSPDVIIGASFLILFSALGIGLGFGSVLLSHIAFSIPIVVLLVLPKGERIGSGVTQCRPRFGGDELANFLTGDRALHYPRNFFRILHGFHLFLG